VQLFSNVLGNAIKFTPDGGTITIMTSAKYLTRLRGGNLSDNGLTTVGGREPRLFVEVAVQDTGIGIEREEQGRIFEKFYEAGNISEHSTGKVAFKAKGAGLGLAIAKGIVEVHGGDIWVESAGYNPEKFPGSTFHILLPVSPAPINNKIDFTNLLH
jgi:signal transduction histidine kinase